MSNNDLDNLLTRPLLVLGDSITTDHISPAGVIKEESSVENSCVIGKYRP